ncbi:MAG: M28 family peptidase, partial [Anaerolineales bacterium]|nr:M28 family peptidase [Anaerolineales bacterium]
LNRYPIGGAVLIFVGASWLQTNSGAIRFYRQGAGEFDTDRAMGYLTTLTAPEYEGRAIGSDGISRMADYLGGEFEALGLQSAGQFNTYYQERSRNFSGLEREPVLEIADGGPPLIYKEDFAPYPGRNITDGVAEAPVRVVLLGPEGQRTFSGFRSSYAGLEDDDFSNEIVLVFSDLAAWYLTRYPKAGMLVVTEDESLLNKRFTLSSRSGLGLNPFTSERTGNEIPSLWISEDTADRMLRGSGYDLDTLHKISEDLNTQEVFSTSLEPIVRMDVDSYVEERFEVRNVIGYIPGSHSRDFCFDCLASQLIVVMAQYDAPPIGLEGVYEAANDNASAVAVMLETIRLLQESEYTPYKTILFVAYSGEGLDGGEVVSDPDVKRFLQAKVGFASNLNLEAVIKIRGLGGGSGNKLEVSAAGSLRLAELLERSAGQMGVGSTRANEPIDISVIYDDDSSAQQGGQDAPIVRVVWDGWYENARTAQDTLENISREAIEEAGNTLTLALMIMGREIDY